MTAICEVHYYALNDSKKREVFYCDMCEAWICKECEGNTKLRFIAAAKRQGITIANTIQNFFRF